MRTGGLVGTWVWCIASAKSNLTIVDQAIVSGVNFLTIVLIGRFAATSELGLYALGMSILIAVQCLQESLITQPYTINRHKDFMSAAQHAGAVLILGPMFSVMSAIVIAGVALGMSSLDRNPEFTAFIWALAVTAPFMLLREFGRQMEFGHLNPANALTMDFAGAVTQIAVLIALGWSGHMSAATALAASAAGCAVASAIWCLLFRRATAFDRHRLPTAMKQGWNLGKWFLGNQMVLVAQANVSIWMLTAIAGPAETGIYAACVSVVSLSNPVVLGLSNLLLAKAAASFREGGGERLRRDTLKDALMLGAIMSLFAGVVSIFGNDIMRLVFPTQPYQNFGLVLAILASWQLVIAISIPPFNALAGMDHARLNFRIGLTAAILTTILLGMFVAEWGVVGAACALLTGAIIRCAARWCAFLMLCAPEHRSDAQPAQKMLPRF